MDLTYKIKMASKYRKITISTSSDELGMMEDFLVCELSEDVEEKYRRKCIRIWQRLIREWDKQENAKH